MTKLPSDDELRDAFWTGYAAASWGEKEVSGMRACAVLAIARMNERAAAPEPSEAEVAAAMASLHRAMEPAAWPSEDEITDALRAAAAAKGK